MIPKVIHYCWFGGNPIPSNLQNYIDGWKKICPDYQIVRWDESNFDFSSCGNYIKEAYQMKKWAFVSDYARLKIIYEYGGIYLDTDVKLIKSLDHLLKFKAFMGIEQDSFGVATGLGFGAEKHHESLKDLLQIYDGMHFQNDDGSMNQTTCVSITTDYFKQHGFVLEDKQQNICNVTILPTDYFCPMNFVTGITTLTENTYSIHCYEFSWETEQEQQIHKKTQKVCQKFGLDYNCLILKLYRKIYRIYFKFSSVNGGKHE